MELFQRTNLLLPGFWLFGNVAVVLVMLLELNQLLLFRRVANWSMFLLATGFGFRPDRSSGRTIPTLLQTDRSASTYSGCCKFRNDGNLMNTRILVIVVVDALAPVLGLFSLE